MAKYPYIVKYNGEWYPSGAEVPEGEDDMAAKEKTLPFSDSEIEFETKPEKRYTKTEINRMKTAELQALAEEVGIENAFETSGEELKKRLTEYFGL